MFWSNCFWSDLWCVKWDINYFNYKPNIQQTHVFLQWTKFKWQATNVTYTNASQAKNEAVADCWVENQNIGHFGTKTLCHQNSSALVPIWCRSVLGHFRHQCRSSDDMSGHFGISADKCLANPKIVWLQCAVYRHFGPRTLRTCWQTRIIW